MSVSTDAAGGMGTAAGGGGGKPRRLGRGLGALIGEPVVIVTQATSVVAKATTATLAPEVEPPGAEPGGGAGAAASAGRRLLHVAVEELEPSPFQPREVFSPEALRELADSIRTAGVMQPIVVRARADGRYELVAGERRWRAARLAGLPTVPAVLTSLSDEEAAQWGLIENVQRQDLGALEKARAFARLSDRFGLTHAQIAGRVGVDRSSVTNHVRLLELEAPIQKLLGDGALSFGHARALLAMAPGPARVALAQRAADESWSVRRTESAAAAAETARPSKAREVRTAPDAAAIEKQIGERLGTKVRLKTRGDGKKGRLVIEFYSLDHFDGLMDKLGVKLKL